MSNRQFLESCESVRNDVINLKQYDEPKIKEIFNSLTTIQSRVPSAKDFRIYREELNDLITKGVASNVDGYFDRFQWNLIDRIDRLAQTGEDRKLTLAEFLDSSANKLSCLGIFNALFIYSLTLDKNLSSKSLVVSFLIFSLLLFFTITKEALNNIIERSYSNVAFFICLIVCSIALSFYSIVKYPEFLHTILFVFSALFYGLIMLKINDINKKHYAWWYHNKFAPFRWVHSITFGNYWFRNGVVLTILSVIFAYLSQEFVYRIISSLLHKK